MQKEALRKLRTLNATRAIMAKGDRLKIVDAIDVDGKTENKYTDFYAVLLRAQNLDGYIKIAVFLPKDIRVERNIPRYEIFLNVEGDEWITRELDAEGKEVSWLSAMLNNLPNIEWFYWDWNLFKNKEVYMTKDTYSTLSALPMKNGSTAKGYKRLIEWQRQKRADDILKKEKRETEPWDKDMQLIPKIMPSFIEWMRRDVCPQKFIIYKYKKSGVKDGFCTGCQRIVPIKHARHGMNGTCPKCGAKIIYKASGRIRTLETDGYDAEVIQKIEGGIVIRQFYQKQSWIYTSDYTKPRITTLETDRVLLFENGKRRCYGYEKYKNKYMRWVPNEYKYRYWRPCVNLYKGNFHSLKKNTILAHSGIFHWKTLPIWTDRYLAEERVNPVIEKLAKIGMFYLAEDFIKTGCDNLVDQKESELHKILKIDRARLKRLREMDGGKCELQWMQIEKQSNTIWPDEMISCFGQGLIWQSNLDALDVGKNYKKIYIYLKKQEEKMMAVGTKSILSTWKDYLNMAKKLKKNTNLEQIAMPSDLKRAHDEVVLMLEQEGMEKKAKELGKKWKKVGEHLLPLKKFEYEADGYCIKVPEGILDIVKEGMILGHCVHSCDYYYDRIQRDESYLFFLRKTESPDMPWYTLEVEPSGNIRQKRTTGDKQGPDLEQAMPFLQKWQQFCKKQLTKEEKELGKKADELRKKNYAELRKKGNKVWHGPLAGRLLAEVLEEDFMEVI